MADIGAANANLIIGKNVVLKVSSATASDTNGTANDTLAKGVSITFQRNYPRTRDLTVDAAIWNHEYPDTVLTGDILVTKDLIEYLFDKNDFTSRGVLETYLWEIELEPQVGTGMSIKFVGALEDVKLTKTQADQGHTIPFDITVLLTQGTLVTASL